MTRINFIIVVLLTVINLNAQNNKKHFSIKAGVNFTNFIDNNSDIPVNFEGKTGFNIGGGISFHIIEKIKFHPEILFSIQKSDFSIKSSDIVFLQPSEPNLLIIGEINNSSIIIPLKFEYALLPKLDLELGPQISYLINNGLKYDESTEGFPIVQPFLLSQNQNDLELSFNLGLKYSLTEKYKIGVNYTYGINKRAEIEILNDIDTNGIRIIDKKSFHSSIFNIELSYEL
ncbi:porin family protein [Aquimarina sp. Aq107]|uniref:porin family protein n=1 Tax=Aquimarina sp. Aq107 TaxID=1191912 RepID=UPI000D556927|nr:porin family protein [Aquimarina sp. Aq107]